MIKVTLAISLLLMTATGPQAPEPRHMPMKDLATCSASAKEILESLVEYIQDLNSPLIGATTFCIVEYVKVDSRDIVD